MPDFPIYDEAYVRERLTNQAPRTQEVRDALDDITRAGIAFGVALTETVPQGPDLRLALGHLEDAVARAKKGVALNQDRVTG